MKRYRKRPVVVEAVRFIQENRNEWQRILNTHDIQYDPEPVAYIKTLEGTMRCNYGDWIIRGVLGELYPCTDEVFQMTYKEVEEE